LELIEGAPFIAPDGHRTWQVQTEQADSRVTFRSFYEAGWIDRGQGCAHLVMRPEGNPENFLRVLYAWETLARGGLLLHASGVVRGEKGYVFFGHSGAGKTTIANLSTPSLVLSDDLVIVRRMGRRVLVYGVPFCGAERAAPRTNAVAPLVALFAPLQAPDHRVEPLSPAAAAGRLASCVPFVMHQPHAIRQVMETCAGLLDLVPSYLLHFRKDSEFWEVIDDLNC
jgi:hypothetical protein